MSKTYQNIENVEWRNINWKKIQRVVFKLQKRIYKASLAGEIKCVRKLQKTLLQSFSAKLLAVRQVSQDNQGKKTAGVDGVKSLSPEERLDLAKKLKLGKKAKPARRVYIPKPNGESRPLGIPTMYDRALQALCKMAIEPEWEAKFEPNSYGFRPGRSFHDAIGAIFKQIRCQDKFVLDADIEKCFDHINHKKLLDKINTFPKLRKQIKTWLKSGFIEFPSGEWQPTDKGTPKGGVISPLLANIALHGMEEVINKVADSLKGYKKENRKNLSLIRYADDFVIMHKSLEVVEQCQTEISKFLAELGLKLKSSKTKIVHTLREHKTEQPGFNFLGFYVRHYPMGKHKACKSTNGKPLEFKTLIRPSKESIQKHYKKIAEVIDLHTNAPQISLISHLAPIIRGWTKYYSAVVSSEAYSNLDNLMFRKLVAWATKRHPNKGWKWIKNKYWKKIGSRSWVFTPNGRDRLIHHFETKVVRFSKVKGDYSPYNGDWIYWSKRKGEYPDTPKRLALLLKKQKGRCNYCGLHFFPEDLMEIDHIIPKSKGGRDIYENLQILHRHCHDRKTAEDNCQRGHNLSKEVPMTMA